MLGRGEGNITGRFPLAKAQEVKTRQVANRENHVFRVGGSLLSHQEKRVWILCKNELGGNRRFPQSSRLSIKNGPVGMSLT